MAAGRRSHGVAGLLNARLWLLPVVTLVVVAGCAHYSSRSLLPENVRTIYVPIFDNRTFRRGIEVELTEALKREILAKTHLRIVAKDEADTILFGEIVDFRESVLIENVADEAVESNAIVYVDFMWKDQRTGQILAEAKGVSESARFVLARGETVAKAKADSFEDLAERIINMMEKEW